MKPVDIHFIGIDRSDALEDAVRRKIAHIQGQTPDLGWRVVIEQPHRHEHQGREFSVRLFVTLHGSEIAVKHAHDEDPYVAVRDAFDAVRRQVEEAVRVRRGDVKRHEHPTAD